MNIVTGFALFMVLWFLCFYLVLQLRTRTQDEAGTHVPGTPVSAPANEDVGRSALIATLCAVIAWGLIAAPILAGWISLADIDVAGVLKPPTSD